MKTKTIFAALLLVVASFVSTSCSKDGDTMKPIIDLHEPENGEAFKPGSEICVEMDLSDDTALGSFYINVHNNFNNHGDHSTKNDDNAFRYDQTSEDLGIDIKGLKNTHRHLHIEIPADATCGDYHLMVYCYDLDGNESYVVRSIVISEDAEEHHHE